MATTPDAINYNKHTFVFTTINLKPFLILLIFSMIISAPCTFRFRNVRLCAKS